MVSAEAEAEGWIGWHTTRAQRERGEPGVGGRGKQHSCVIVAAVSGVPLVWPDGADAIGWRRRGGWGRAATR